MLPSAPPSLAAAALAVLLFAACGGDGGQSGAKQQGPPPAVQVTTAPAARERVVYYDGYPGTVSALNEVEVRPQIAGYVTAVHFAEGQEVRRGERLYTVDTRQYDASLENAEAEVRAAEADLALARKDVDRYTRLAEAEAVAQQVLDQATAAAEARTQALASARTRVAQARTQLDYATVTAPISGITGLAPAKVGTQVSPGAPVLTTISQARPAGVDVAVPQAIIPRLARAEADPGSVADSTFRIRLPGGETYPHYGAVYALDRAVNPATGTLTTRLAFDNPAGELRPGMNLTVEILNPGSGEHVTVPATALAEQMGEAYVFVKRDSVALRRKVTTGTRFRDRVVVLEGLSGGEEVVTSGLNQVRDSTKVRAANAPLAGGGAAGGAGGASDAGSADSEAARAD